mmetsp:Transcript_434/g.765  ORF Transcript_434/g.765 Transcript_434/m.765 type:complete len:163 (-) Transcript_434:215-703(-)
MVLRGLSARSVVKVKIKIVGVLLLYGNYSSWYSVISVQRFYRKDLVPFVQNPYVLQMQHVDDKELLFFGFLRCLIEDQLCGSLFLSLLSREAGCQVSCCSEFWYDVQIDRRLFDDSFPSSNEGIVNIWAFFESRVIVASIGASIGASILACFNDFGGILAAG